MKTKTFLLIFTLVLLFSCRSSKTNVQESYPLQVEAVKETIEATATTDPGVVIMGVRWATRNVDAPGTFTENPEDAGMFFQWNRRHGWNATDTEILGWNRSIPGGTTWSRENDPCPEGWRVPTPEEFRLLMVHAESTWAMLNGVSGRWFGSRHNSIFLPAVGFRATNDGRLLSSVSDMSLSDVVGAYWSNNEFIHNRDRMSFNRETAMSMQVSRRSINLVSNRRNGFNVRCVAIDKTN